jgi:hypothetical protein
VWKTVIAEKDTKLNEKAPKFYLFLGKDESGKDMYTNKVPVLRKDGSVMTDPSGNAVRRFVGPQDLVQGAIVKPVFNFSKVYQVASFGVHLALQAIFIKPPPPKPSVEVDDAAIVDNYDPLVAARVLHQSAEGAPIEDAPASDNDEALSIPAPALEESEAPADIKSPLSGKKRAADGATATKAKKTKPSTSASFLEEA